MTAFRMALAFLIALTFTACTPADAPSITVFAASSLTDSFTELCELFEKENSSYNVVVSFGASSTLATQLINGAPADVFASASQQNMTVALDAGVVDDPAAFARNTLTIAVPGDNPADVDSLDDLASPSTKVAVCQPAAPCGVLATKVFANAGLHVTPVTQEADARAVLTKVVLGEVDAGLVYATDAIAAGDRVASVEIPAALNASTDYQIAVVTDSGDRAIAQAFVDLVLSERGASVLADAGFARP